MARQTERKPKRKAQSKGRSKPTNKPKAKQATLGDQSWKTWAPRPASGTRVDYDNALTFATVWCCVRVISETLGVMPWQVYRNLANGKGRERDSSHAVDWILNNEPNPETSPITFKETIFAHCTSWGNGYAEIERDYAERPIYLWILTPDRVTPIRLADGRIVYEVRNFTSDPSYIEPRNMLHVPGLGFDGLVGYSVVHMAARSIGLGLDMESNASAFWANQSMPSGVLKHPQTLKEEGQKRLKQSWEAAHRGPQNAGRIAILEEGMDYLPIGMHNNDAQFLESRQFSVIDICRWFRVPPHKVYELGRATWNNLESMETDFIGQTIMPWATRGEQEANRKLFGIQQRGKWYTKFNANALMRGDSAARGEFYTKLSGLGALSVNEIREKEDMNPIGEDGDKRLVQLNLTTLEKVGQEPEPAKSADPPQEGDEPAQGDEGDGKEPRKEPVDARRTEKVVQAMFPVIKDAFGRMFSREQHRLADINKRTNGNAEQREAAVTAFYAEHANYAMTVLTTPARGMFHMLGGDPQELPAAIAWTVAIEGQRSREMGTWTEARVDTAASTFTRLLTTFARSNAP